MSDGITRAQLPKIMTYLSCILNYYLGQTVGVNSKPEPGGPPVLAVLAVYLTFSEI
jgi:hypothetical protein